HIRRLAKRLGLQEFPTYDTGNDVYYADGERLAYSDATPTGVVPPDPLIVADAAAAVTELDQMATTVPVDAPWDAASARHWDGQTLEAWLRTNSTYAVNQRFQRLIGVATRPIFGAEAR